MIIKMKSNLFQPSEMYFEKPFRADVLMAAVDMALRKA